jgi:hypothetical protein
MKSPTKLIHDFLATLTLLAASTSLAVAQSAKDNDAAGNDSSADSAFSDRPVASWNFDGKDALGQWSGAPPKPSPGPRSPVYPDFPANNQAGYFNGRNGLVTHDAGNDSPLRFGLGDSITLEAWMKVEELKDGNYAYIVGKGRTKQKSKSELNQNYALRLTGEKGQALASFLFASAPDEKRPGGWHRWTSKEGFQPGGWHHVAVSYTFGKPNSIRGYIDGKKVSGAWDMEGATDRAPVEDDDDLVIGAGNGNGPGNAFRGWVDAVAIWRTALDEETLVNRYEFVPPVPVVDRGRLPAGRVLVEICEKGVPEQNAWPPEPPTVSESYEEDAFGLFETPHKYVDTGVRGDRPIPYLLRAAAVVRLPAGNHRLLLRGRGASRLYVDGRMILSTPFPPPSSDGHHPIPTDYLDLGPDFRFAPPGNRERWTDWETAGGEHLVVLETLVGSLTGNRKRRPELGETVVAISREGETNWKLLSPGERKVPYTDEGWAAYEQERRIYLAQLNAERRKKLRGEHAAYGQKRRNVAKAWLNSTPEITVPTLPKGYPSNNPIDHFLSAKLQTAAAQVAQIKPGAIDFYRDVQPILQARCADCHQGPKVQGNLRLESRAAALLGGDSGPAFVPGKPDQSELLARIRATGGERMPPKGDPLKPAEIEIVERWIREGAVWPELKIDRVEVTTLCDDLTFLRRATLDTIGLVPSLDEIRRFEADPPAERRRLAIDRLLSDPRGADHWTGYWQDVLAENPNILNPTLNNTGPFRWWIYESLLDDKPIDLFVTELVRMKGSERLGGPAGFGVASQNDVPMAAKGTVVSAAFLGVEMKCARCHDAPYHTSTQEQLFQLAAMLGTSSLEVPKSSSVPLDKLHQGGRKPLIQVTLKPGTKVEPRWPFASLGDEATGGELAEYPEDARDRLAALITGPQNERFAQVIANRIWQRLMGRGLVEPVDDWERGQATHPELLRWLGRELIRSGYQVKQMMRLILNSHAYQRAVDPNLRETSPLYAARSLRRIGAEQLVDSLFFAVGKGLGTEEVSLDVDGQRDNGNSLSLGRPTRAWMFSSTSNERDRPSLSLPRVQAVVDVLAAFGWRPSRQDPTTAREQAVNILQPAVLANGTMSVWLTRLSDDHGVTELATQSDLTVEQLLDNLFLRMLTRKPTEEERARYLPYLAPGFAERVQTADSANKPAGSRKPPRYVSWSNHLSEEANAIKIELEAAARRGDPPTNRLASPWRARLEDVLWALVNSPEWIYIR